MKKVAFAAFIVLFTASVQAGNTVRFYLGGQIWQSGTRGTFGEVGEKDDLIDFNLKKERQSSYFVGFEHPFPLLPNLRVSSAAMDAAGTTNLTREIRFDGETFSVNSDVNASSNISYVDYTLYYELIEQGRFSFDLGVTARDLEGGLTVTGETIVIFTSTGKPVTDDACRETNQADKCGLHTSTHVPTGKAELAKILPMLHAATNIGLPFMGLSAFAQVDVSLKSDYAGYDYQVGLLSYDLAHRTTMDFNLILGYRAMKIAFETTDNLYTEIESKGAFAAMVVSF